MSRESVRALLVALVALVALPAAAGLESDFERARELFDEITPLKLCDGRFNILSMGMSGDYELAIEHGANMVRIGSSIFGPRPNIEGDAEEDGDADDGG